MARHGVTAIEVGEHERSRICLRHDHLVAQGPVEKRCVGMSELETPTS